MVQAFSEVTDTLEDINAKQENESAEKKQAEEAVKDAEEKKLQHDAAFVGTGTNFNPDLQPLGLPAPGQMGGMGMSPGMQYGGMGGMGMGGMGAPQMMMQPNQGMGGGMPFM